MKISSHCQRNLYYEVYHENHVVQYTIDYVTEKCESFIAYATPLYVAE